MHAPLAIKQPARWRVIVAGICALILTVGLARFAYTPMLPIMREQAGLTHWAAGWLARACACIRGCASVSRQRAAQPAAIKLGETPKPVP